MMSAFGSVLGFLFKRFAERPDRIATILDKESHRYGDLLAAIGEWTLKLDKADIGAGAVVLLKADYSFRAIACLLALLDKCAIVIPVATASAEKADEFAALGEAEYVVDLFRESAISKTGVKASHDLYATLRNAPSAGIVLFSSGSTGKSKGAVHDVDRLLLKFHARRQDLRTIAFLLLDHIGGLDTLFYCLSNCSTLVFTPQRDPESVFRVIEEHRVEVLPAAPSFLNITLLSRVQERFDCSSLKIITYGAEIMPQRLLERCAYAFPNVKLMQKYGTTEFGAMRSHSRDNCSRWVKLGGEGYECRVRDGKLEVKSSSAMLGYLNAPSPFTDDGYFMTGDCVEVDGDYFRFKGRDSDIINVGGQKVYPAEVESMIKEMPGIADAAVFGAPHPLLGKAVYCRLQPVAPNADPQACRMAVRKFLAGRLEAYKIPQKYFISSEPLATDRFKKIRS